MVDVGKIAKTSQEQAIAAWVDYLNQVRITDLIASLNQQDGNLQDALDSLRSTVETLQSNVIEIGRGGQYNGRLRSSRSWSKTRSMPAQPPFRLC